jgi:CRISPR type IV-associated protein Csf1
LSIYLTFPATGHNVCTVKNPLRKPAKTPVKIPARRAAPDVTRATPFVSASTIARQGFHLRRAIGPRASTATFCQLCGQPIPKGKVAVPWKSSPGWMDEAAYACHSGVLCEDCPPLLSAPVLRAGGVLVNAKRALRLLTFAELGRAIADPPLAPPFVAVFPTGKQQHLFWRAAVTLDPSCFRLQWGERSVVYDVPRLRALEADARRLSRHLPLPAGKTVRTMHHPFARLGLKAGDVSLQFRKEVLTAATRDAMDRAAVARLSRCTPDDAFALAGLTYGPVDARAALIAVRPVDVDSTAA